MMRMSPSSSTPINKIPASVPHNEPRPASTDREIAVLVSASATGFYGARGEEILTEEAPGGNGFLCKVCDAWEHATAPAEAAGIRVVHARFGVVLSPFGGALKQMLPLFRMGLGGRLGRRPGRPGGRLFLGRGPGEAVRPGIHRPRHDLRIDGNDQGYVGHARRFRTGRRRQQQARHIRGGAGICGVRNGRAQPEQSIQ